MFDNDNDIDKNITTLKHHETKLSVRSGDGENFPAMITVNGYFNVFVAKPGIYKVEIFNTNFYFEPVIVQVITNEEQEMYPNKKKVSAYLYDTKTGGKGVRLLYPLQLEPSHRLKYFDIEEPFNPLVYLKSPYFLMIGFSMLMMFMMK